jgi:hypothetical protein
MKLAKRVSPGRWELADGWQKVLRELGERGDIIKQMHRALSGDLARYRIVRPGEALDVENAKREVVGRVADKGLADELKGTFYAVIETPNGRAYHVPLSQRVADSISKGDMVSFATPRDEKGQYRVALRKELSLDEQVRRLEPVWLDRVEAAALAPYGFGSELRGKLQERRELQRQRGIEGPKKETGLDLALDLAKRNRDRGPDRGR